MPIMPNNEFVSAEGYAALVASGVITKEEAREYFGFKIPGAQLYMCVRCGEIKDDPLIPTVCLQCGKFFQSTGLSFCNDCEI